MDAPLLHRPPVGRRAVGALLLAVVALACSPHVDGDGVFREERRDVPAFQGIAIDSGIQALVTVGGQTGVTVSGDENLLQWVETTVSQDAELGVPVLQVKVDLASYTSFHPLRAVITVPSLRLVRAAGASDVGVSGAAAAQLTVSAKDASDVTVSGAGAGADSLLQVVLSGTQHGGHLDARQYPVARAQVDLSGDSRAELDASGEVAGTAPPPALVENSGAGVCSVTDGAGGPVSCAAP